MAGSTNIDGKSVDDALINFDFRAAQKNFKPYFKIKIGADYKYTNIDTDITFAREQLAELLEIIRNRHIENNLNSIVQIMYYKNIDKKEELCGTPETYNVKFFEDRHFLPANQQPVNNQLLSTLSSIDERLKKLEEEEEEEEEEEANFLSGIYKDPDMKRALMQMLISGLGGNKTPQTINGVPGQDPQNESDKIRTALKVIAQHTKTLGDDLLKLASMAENDPAQFNFLLTMLRK